MMLPEACWFQEGPGLRQWQFKTSGMKVINVTNLENSVLNLDHTDRHIALSEFNRLYQHFAIDTGDMVMASSGNSYGKTAIVREQDLPLMMNTSVIRVKPTGETVYGFLWAFLNSSLFKNQIDLMITGGAQPNFGPYHLKRVLLPFPSLPEQRAIATALSDVDRLIGALDALIEKKRAIKQAAMQQLLTGKTRLPGFSGECEMRYIGEFTDCTAGGTPSTLNPEYWGGQIRWMSSGELNHKIVLDVEGRITDKGLRNSSTKIIPPRCVLVGLAGQGKTRGTVAMNMVELCTNQSIAAIFPNDTFVPEYLYYNLDARYDELRGMSSGAGGRGGLNLRIIRSIAVPFPSVSEQHAIATILSDMDADIAALERRREKAEQIKQGIMQQLLTGRIRLPSVGEASDQ